MAVSLDHKKRMFAHLEKQQKEHPTPASPPPLDYDTDGWCSVKQYRLRPILFGCFLEQLHVCQDGRQEWRRVNNPISISELLRDGALR